MVLRLTSLPFASSSDRIFLAELIGERAPALLMTWSSLGAAFRGRQTFSHLNKFLRIIRIARWSESDDFLPSFVGFQKLSSEHESGAGWYLLAYDKRKLIAKYGWHTNDASNQISDSTNLISDVIRGCEGYVPIFV